MTNETYFLKEEVLRFLLVIRNVSAGQGIFFYRMLKSVVIGHMTIIDNLGLDLSQDTSMQIFILSVF